MHGPINVKSPNNTNKWQMGFNSAFKGFNRTEAYILLISKLYASILHIYIYDMIFIYCNCVFTLWQWSVSLYKNRKQTATYKRRNNVQTIQKQRIHKIENKHTKTRKQI